VKDRYLYADIPNNSGSYEVLEKVLNMCLIPAIEFVMYLENCPSHMTRLDISLHCQYMTRQMILQRCVNKS